MDDYTNLAIKIEGVDNRCKSNERRIDAHDVKLQEFEKKQDAIYELASSVKSIAKDMTYIKEDVQEVKSGQNDMSQKITILENRPAIETKKRLDYLYEKLLWLTVGGIVTFLLYNILPGISW